MTSILCNRLRRMLRVSNIFPVQNCVFRPKSLLLQMKNPFYSFFFSSKWVKMIFFTRLVTLPLWSIDLKEFLSMCPYRKRLSSPSTCPFFHVCSGGYIVWYTWIENFHLWPLRLPLRLKAIRQEKHFFKNKKMDLRKTDKIFQNHQNPQTVFRNGARVLHERLRTNLVN